jgi:hypothetical protein
MGPTLVDREFFRCLRSDGVAPPGADPAEAMQLGTRLGRHTHAIRLAEADHVCRRKHRPHEAHPKRVDIHGAPAREALISQPQANRREEGRRDSDGVLPSDGALLT